jgi:hypothetical protein
MSDYLEKRNFVTNFLTNLCSVDCKKYEVKINKLFYQTLHILIVEEQAKLIFKLLTKDKEFQGKKQNDLYR